MEIIPQNFLSSGLSVSEELTNKQTNTDIHKMTDIFYFRRRIVKTRHNSYLNRISFLLYIKKSDTNMPAAFASKTLANLLCLSVNKSHEYFS